MPFAHLPEVIQEVQPLAEAFVTAGHRVYLVGGVVRDLWLDAALDDSTDIDLTTDAEPREIRAAIGPLADAVWAQGERFGTIGCRVNRRDIEITTHRSEVYRFDSRKPSVSFSTAVTDDLSRRDFTVNAMAIELPTGEVVDPFGGAADLQAGRLRTPLGARVSFTDDPLRMLRAARFAARYSLEPDEELVSAMAELADRLDIVAIERVRDEFEKLLAVEDPTEALMLLGSTGLLERVVPGFAASSAIDERPPQAVAATDASDLLGRVAAVMWWDIDEPTATVARSWGERLRLSKAEAEALARIVVSVAGVGDALVDSASLRRWAFSAGEQRRRALVLARQVDPEGADELARRVGELGVVEDLDDPGIPVDGSEIMAELGVGPGPQVGAALAHLQELRFRDGPLSREAALAALRDLRRR